MSKGVTLDDPLIFTLENVIIAAIITIKFKWSSAEKIISGFSFIIYLIIGISIYITRLLFVIIVLLIWIIFGNLWPLTIWPIIKSTL